MQRQLLEDFNKKAARKEFGMALNANTAFANLLDRQASIDDVIQLTKEDKFLIVNCGTTHFTKWDAEWLFFGGKGESFSIEDLTSSEDIYLRTEVSEEESMKVGSIPLQPIVGKTIRNVLTTTSVGLYQIGSGMYEWAGKLTDRLIKRRGVMGKPLLADDALKEYQMDPEWVNDDSLLIARCLRDTEGRTSRTTSVILVSADRRLGHQMSNSCNVTVVRIDPRQYILLCGSLEVPPLTEIEPHTLCKHTTGVGTGIPVPTFTYVDTGSVNAFLARMDSLSVTHATTTRVLRSSGGGHDGQLRKVTYEVKEIPTRQSVHGSLHYPVLKQKRFPITDPLPSEPIGRRPSMVSRSSRTSVNWRSGN